MFKGKGVERLGYLVEGLQCSRVTVYKVLRVRSFEPTEKI